MSSQRQQTLTEILSKKWIQVLIFYLKLNTYISLFFSRLYEKVIWETVLLLVDQNCQPHYLRDEWFSGSQIYIFNLLEFPWKSELNWFCTNLHKDLGRLLNFIILDVIQKEATSQTLTNLYHYCYFWLVSPEWRWGLLCILLKLWICLSNQCCFVFKCASESLGDWFLTYVSASLTTKAIIFRKRRHWAYLSIFSTTTRFASLFITCEIIILVSPLIHYWMFYETRLKKCSSAQCQDTWVNSELTIWGTM